MSKHHTAAGWANVAKTARQRIGATLPAPCIEGCGQMVLASQPWDVGHLTPLSAGGDITRYGAAHRSCNRRAGGKRGAAVSNGRKRARALDPRQVKW